MFLNDKPVNLESSAYNDNLYKENNEDVTLNEALTPSKRKQIEDLVLTVFSIVDKTNINTNSQKEFFKSMSDQQFEKWLKSFLKDDEQNFYMSVFPYKNEPTLKDIKEGADYLGIPLDEYVYYKHDGDKNDPVRTVKPVPVGYLPVKRLQQILSKKNSFSLDIDKRNLKTNQLTGDDKVA